MRRTFLILIFILLIVVVLLLIWFYRVGHKRDDVLILYGNVDVRQVELGFRVFGRIQDMLFDEGDFVPKGKLMASLEKQPYIDQYNQAEAAEQASRLAFQNSEQLLARRKRLAPQGGVSQEDLENVESQRNINFANLNQRVAAFATSKTNLGDTEIYCPNDGIILTRVREPGAVVNVGEPIYTLSILSPVWVRAYVNEIDLGRIYQGMKAKIMTDANRTYEGHIGFISPVSEFTPKTVETTELRTSLVYRIRILADNPDRYLKQGMPVTVSMPLEKKDDAIETPR